MIGPRAAERAPDGFFEVVHEGMRPPGFRTPMLSHMGLAMRLGRPRPESFLSDGELRQLTVPVLMIWGDEDPYGGPDRPTSLRAATRRAHGDHRRRHAPFLDDPERCGALIDELLRRATMTYPPASPQRIDRRFGGCDLERIDQRRLRRPLFCRRPGLSEAT